MTPIPLHLEPSGALRVGGVQIAMRHGRLQWFRAGDAGTSLGEPHDLAPGQGLHLDGVRLGGLPQSIMVGGVGSTILVTTFDAFCEPALSAHALSGMELDGVVIHRIPSTESSVPATSSAAAFADTLSSWRRASAIASSAAVVIVGSPDQLLSRRRAAAWGVRWVEPGSGAEGDTSQPQGWVEGALAPSRSAAGAATLVLGPAASGKSAHAEDLLAGEGTVCYLASHAGDPSDGDWIARVERHRRRRPAWWSTVEDTGSATAASLLGSPGSALLWDSVGGWVAASLDRLQAWDRPSSMWDSAYETAIAELIQAWSQPQRRIVAVSEETGWGVIPATASGRLFRERLADLNRRLADAATCHLVVAGRVSELERW